MASNLVIRQAWSPRGSLLQSELATDLLGWGLAGLTYAAERRFGSVGMSRRYLRCDQI